MSSMVPDVPGHPLIGNLMQFRQDPLTFTHHTAFENGRITKLRLGPVDMYMISHPDDIQRVLRDNNHNYVKDYTVYPLFVVSGEGLVNLEGKPWLDRRRALQPHFHRKQVLKLIDLMQSAVEERFSMLDRFAEEGDYIDATNLMRLLTVHVFTKALYGLSMSETDTKAVSDAMGTVINYIWQRYITYRFIPEWAPYHGKREFNKSRQLLHDLSRKLIQRRKKLGLGDDLLSMMIDMASDDGTQLSTDQLHKETVSLFQGAFDTSAGTLAWAFYAISQHPEVEEKLLLEYDQVLGDRPPSSDTVMSLTYTHQVIQEVMRLYPVAPSVLRLALEEDQLGEYTIPAGAMINVSFVNVHRNGEFWPDPLAFKPKRFADGEHKATHHRFAYVPFASGPRRCIGDQFALFEMRLTLASILQRYKVHLDPSYTLEVSAASTYFPKRLPMKFERR